jgi:acyl-CoA synthetase (NDP forming)
MALNIRYDEITAIFQRAYDEGRTTLFEHGVYELLRASGAESVPETRLLAPSWPPGLREMEPLPCERVVLKVVSPSILHKTDAGGVRFVENDPGAIVATWSDMLEECPLTYADWLLDHPHEIPERFRGLSREELARALREDIRGILVCQFIPMESDGFGGELYVGLRHTREFGTIISSGLGGIYTELFAVTMKEGCAVRTASAHLETGAGFMESFRETVSYQKLAGLTRGSQRLVADANLEECFQSFICMGNYYSPENPDAPFIIEELEVNPFAFAGKRMFPLDGLCRFSPARRPPPPRPVEKISHLLHPRSIAIIGVSLKTENMGRIILQNIFRYGFPKERIYVIRPGVSEIEGVRCVGSVAELPEKVDLFVMAVGAPQVPGLVDQLIEHDRAEAVILIPGGLGEVEGSEGLVAEMQRKIRRAQAERRGPVFIGGNSLGVVSRSGHYDTMFIPESKLPKKRDGQGSNIAFISQSGAFMITRMSKLGMFDPAYAISVGNQIDLTVSDLLRAMKDDPDVQVFAVYIEGFKDLDGLAFARAAKEVLRAGKDLIFYKAGRTPEGRTATSSHTASIAGDYAVCETLLAESGACIAKTFTEFEELLMIASLLHEKTFCSRHIACLSNAGFEAVGMADHLHDGKVNLKLAAFTPQTRERLAQVLSKHRIDSLVTVKNPMDVTPMATDQAVADCIHAMLDDPGVGCVLAGFVPLTPAMQTLPEELAEDRRPERSGMPGLLGELLPRYDKPLLAVVDSGSLFDPLTRALIRAGIPTFRSADRAMWVLARFIEYRLSLEHLRCE